LYRKLFKATTSTLVTVRFAVAMAGASLQTR
jgi:hypothetical protein